MNNLTIAMAVFGQPMMLAKQLDTIRGYPDGVLERLRVFIVDDHGAPPVDETQIKELALLVKEARLYRVDDDIKWNQGGARNLAMQEAGGWVAMLDPDMVLDSEVIQKILAAVSKMKQGSNLRFLLKHVRTGEMDNTSPNTHILHRNDFWKAGGYDEDFAGAKGYSDVMLMRCLRAVGIKSVWRDDIFAHFYGLKDVPDAIVTTIDRSLRRNTAIFRSKVKKIGAVRNGWKWWAQRGGDRIRFRWTRLV